MNVPNVAYMVFRYRTRIVFVLKINLDQPTATFINSNTFISLSLTPRVNIAVFQMGYRNILFQIRNRFPVCRSYGRSGRMVTGDSLSILNPNKPIAHFRYRNMIQRVAFVYIAFPKWTVELKGQAARFVLPDLNLHCLTTKSTIAVKGALRIKIVLHLVL